MQVNVAQCTGCGVCVDICPNGAIQLSGGIATLDQTACTQCQACADVCPVGAITAVELPVAVMEPVAIQPVREAEIVVAKPIPSNPKPWLSATLAFAGRELLPRLAEALIAILDRRLTQPQPAHSQDSLPSRNPARLPGQTGRQRQGPRDRPGQVRRRRRGEGRGAGKRKWFLDKGRNSYERR